MGRWAAAPVGPGSRDVFSRRWSRRFQEKRRYFPNLNAPNKSAWPYTQLGATRNRIATSETVSISSMSSEFMHDIYPEEWLVTSARMLTNANECERVSLNLERSTLSLRGAYLDCFLCHWSTDSIVTRLRRAPLFNFPSLIHL